MRTYYVYILQCRDGLYYTGITNNISGRVDDHQTGVDPKCFTFRRRPVKLVYSTEFSNPEIAIEVEKQIKGWSRKKKEALINENWDELRLLAACRNESHFRNKEVVRPFDSAQGDTP
jgi:putative endonuclease